jgi:thiol-disulfide isomerase/thioredoxin
MDALAVTAALAALVALATSLGLIWRARQGRVLHAGGHDVVRAADLPGLSALASGATLVQFSTEFCSSCGPTRALLARIADRTSGVRHVDIDLTHRPDLAARFSVLQTPTTLVLDGRGVIRARIGGAPRPAELAHELDRILEAA